MRVKKTNNQQSPTRHIHPFLGIMMWFLEKKTDIYTSYAQA
jgi:hypothetical protein